MSEMVNPDVGRFRPIPQKLSKLQRAILLWCFRVLQGQTEQELIEMADYRLALSRKSKRIKNRLSEGDDVSDGAETLFFSLIDGPYSSDDLMSDLRSSARYTFGGELGYLVRWQPSIFRANQESRGQVHAGYDNVPGFGWHDPQVLREASRSALSRSLDRLQARGLLERLSDSESREAKFDQHIVRGGGWEDVPEFQQRTKWVRLTMAGIIAANALWRQEEHFD